MNMPRAVAANALITALALRPVLAELIGDCNQQSGRAVE
jgi:hypothetical protein